jgi:tetratricopeptide (TPR) repeat protein
MHGCVHAWMMHVVNKQWDDGMARLARRCVGLHVPGRDAPQYWVTQQRLLRHASRCMDYIDATLARQDEGMSTVGAIHNLGDLYAAQGKLDKAEEMYEQALAGYEKTLGRDHTSTLNTVNNLGSLYADQGRLNRAEEMYKRALTGCEKALGRDHTSTLHTVNNLGVLYAAQDRLDKAEQMFERALTGREKALGRDHTSTLSTVNNLGSLYKAQGKLDKAEEMYKRALEGYGKCLGSNDSIHLWVAFTTCQITML